MGERVMGEIMPFPGLTEISEVPEDELDLDATCARQSDLLARWVALGSELKRRVEHLPFDVSLELCDLINETDG
jgi:hypothetical protein